MKKDYYIQGDPARAEEIKAAFEAKGFNTLGINFENKTLLYFSFEGCIKHCSDDWFFTHLIKTHPDYQELDVERNFKVDDWIVQNDNGTVSQITKVINGTDEYGEYRAYEHTNGYFAACSENKFHLWTIQDAKDGDVLATDNGWTCIFQAFDGWTFSSYCFMDSKNWFCEFGSEAHTPDSSINGNIHPTTKEQRDLFFKRMREAGYQWNPDKKELCKIIEPSFKVGDWITDGNITIRIEDVRNNSYTYSDGVLYSTRTADKVYHLWSMADAKDGDVLVCYSEVKGGPIEQAGIFKQYVGRYGGCSNTFLAHTGIDWDGDIIINGYMGSTNILPATKEQRELLFAKIKEAGYEWDTENKELKKIQPHYGISNFHAGMPVLVRDADNSEWKYVAFSHYREEGTFCACGSYWYQCIPFEGNEKLLGTTDLCEERYINW